jgi:AcrR family transcriptional regulator
MATSPAVCTSVYILTRIPVQTKLLPRAERRASILRGAAEAFARSGFDRTSMEEVAASCGVTRLILYRHFETKEKLYRAILQEVFDRLGEELQAGLAAGSTRGLGARTLLVVARDDPAAFTLLWRHAAREPQFAEYASQFRLISVDVVRRFIPLGSDNPVIDAWIAESLFGWLVEATLTWLECGDPALDAEFVERATAGLVGLRSAWS